MSAIYDAPGLRADWLNGWLGAIGVTVVVPGVRLGWTDEACPHAVFYYEDGLTDNDFIKKLSEGIPNKSILEQSVLNKLPRKVTLDEFRKRARCERELGSMYLASSVSDLLSDAEIKKANSDKTKKKADTSKTKKVEVGIEECNLVHGAFDPSAPRTTGSVYDRALRCAEKIPDNGYPKWIRESLAGNGERVKTNGLGFDSRRLASGVQVSKVPTSPHADPVVELLCLAALAIFPTRGDGSQVFQRGWSNGVTKKGAFKWVAWHPALDRWGIDAFLDLDHSDVPGNNVNVIARYEVVPRQPNGQSDVNRAYCARRVS